MSQLLSFPNAQELARAAAQEWCAALTGDSQTVALSGGRIASEFFASIVQCGQENAALRTAHFFWADERCVPPGDPESNYRAARELLLDPLGIDPSRIHRIRGEDDPARAAHVASEELQTICGDRSVLDWVFLGMGEDGHVASLFPGAEARHGIYYDTLGPKPPPRRITLSYDMLARARQVWVLASGKGKEAALRESLRADGATPLARVLKSRGDTRIFSDFLP